MVYKGRRIGSGDVLWSMSGEKVTISNWSTGSGDIYVNAADGTHQNIKNMPPLSWNFPFISTRIDRSQSIATDD